jgi:Ca2+:H+ antiporter
MMVLAAFAMLVPAVFHRLVGEKDAALEHKLSLAVSVALILAYLLSLVFSLVTHRDLYNPTKDEPPDADVPSEAPRGGQPALWKPVVVLLVSTGLVVWMSEILVGTVETASEALGMTQVFVGVFVVAIVGNAAEHSTAVWMALKNQMDLAVGIALGSALQIALFVAPVLVFASYLRPEPLDLLFTPLEVAAMFLGVIIAYMVAEDGESNWLEGAMLLLIYAILGMAFFFLPNPAAGRPQGRAEPGLISISNASVLTSQREPREHGNVALDFTGHRRDGSGLAGRRGGGATPGAGCGEEGPRAASRDVVSRIDGSRRRGSSA